MSAMPSHPQPGLSAALLVRPSVDADAACPVKNDQLPSSRLSLGKRAPLALARHLIVFFVGVAATLGVAPTLAWQTYGDAARQLIAPTASTSGQQQLNTMSLDLDAVRRSIDGLAISIGTSIASSQEQTTRSIDQLTAVLEQMTHEIAKLQAVGRYGLYKNSDPPRRPAPAQVPKPVPRSAQAPTAR